MGRICYVCNIEKEDRFFKLDYKKGKKYKEPTNKCLACAAEEYKKYVRKDRPAYNEKTRNRRLARKIRAIEYKGGVCSACGNSFHPAAMDFHHLDPTTKDKDPGLMMSTSDEVLFKELDKCILLCANCHRIFHYENGY